MAKNQRTALSKKTRFDIFKRDAFCCQYCGKTPPAVVLEVDHVLPVAAGGTNATHNLITACFDCNRGKSDGLLSVVPASIAEQAELAAEKLAQIKAYDRLIKAQRRTEEAHIDEVQGAFQATFVGYTFTPKFRQSVRIFLRNLPVHQLVDYMYLACSRIRKSDDALSYFCGICWRQIKGDSDR